MLVCQSALVVEKSVFVFYFFILFLARTHI